LPDDGFDEAGWFTALQRALRQPVYVGADVTLDEYRAQAAAQARQHHLEIKRAWNAAMVTLKATLTPEQVHQLEHDDCFDVTSSRGRRWRIRAYGQSGNVDLLGDDGSVMARFCAHPPGRLPDPVAWLAQARILMHDEVGFLAVAIPHMVFTTTGLLPPPLAHTPRRRIWPIGTRARYGYVPEFPRPPCYTTPAGRVHVRPSCRCHP
jgi:hypothetical protein